MTSDEKDRLEIAKEVCSFQACTLLEIYNFVKAGKTVAGLGVEEAEGVTIDGWVARDEDGLIFTYGRKPVKRGREWHGFAEAVVKLPMTSFPTVTWESEPLEVTITFKPKKK